MTDEGYLRSYWGERSPERGNMRRRYYMATGKRKPAPEKQEQGDRSGLLLGEA